MDVAGMVSGKGEGTGAGDRFSPGDYENVLITLVNPTLKTDVDTQYGPCDAAFCDYIVVLEGDDKGVVFRGSALWGAALVPEVTSASGLLVAGKITQGTAKKGQSAPWLWEDPSEAEREEVVAWFKENAVDDGQGGINLPQPEEG